MNSLQPHETRLTGAWLVTPHGVKGDEACNRIAELLKEQLKELARDASGWDALYRDTRDGRLWELIYPHGEMHGGGPPELICLSDTEARRKYSY